MLPLSTILPHFAVIRVLGADAARFLHGQLSHDFLLMQSNDVRLAAYCNPKGRMIASTIARRLEEPNTEPGFDLIVSSDLVEVLLKRLRMFVLRAKVTLHDMRNQLYVQGHIGQPSAASTPPWTLYQQRITLPSSQGLHRQLTIVTDSSLSKTVDERALAYWNWLDVQSGVAMVQAATSELFVPQMLNYESVGGVNFQKGCYPGQEVVARSQFRGQIKRRGFILVATEKTEHSSISLGSEVFSLSEPDTPCGTVAQYAKYDHQIALIASLQTQATIQSNHFTCQGIEFSTQPLPYNLLEDI